MPAAVQRSADEECTKELAVQGKCVRATIIMRELRSVLQSDPRRNRVLGLALGGAVRIGARTAGFRISEVRQVIPHSTSRRHVALERGVGKDGAGGTVVD